MLAAGTQELPDPTTQAEPMLLEAARRLDPPRLRRVLAHLRLVADPDGEGDRAEQRHGRRGLWLSPTWEGMVAMNGLLEAEAGQTLLAALEPLARPASADDDRTASQRRADALTEVARRHLEAAGCPRPVGSAPTHRPWTWTACRATPARWEVSSAGPSRTVDPEACRRLACDGAVTRVLVTRHPTPAPPVHERRRTGRPQRRSEPGARSPGLATPPPAGTGVGEPRAVPGPGVAAAGAVALLPAVLGGAPTQPLEVGRASRVVQPAQRAALAVRDGGCAFPGCDRPQARGVRRIICGTGCMAARPT